MNPDYRKRLRVERMKQWQMAHAEQLPSKQSSYSGREDAEARNLQEHKAQKGQDKRTSWEKFNSFKDIETVRTLRKE